MTIKLVEFEPNSGESLTVCITQSLIYAVNNQVSVVFTHNDLEFTTNYNQIFTLVSNSRRKVNQLDSEGL